jgi:hypothetical protein
MSLNTVNYINLSALAYIDSAVGINHKQIIQKVL